METRKVSGVKNHLSIGKLSSGALVSRGPMLFSDVIDMHYDYFGQCEVWVIAKTGIGKEKGHFENNKS